jgi:hypothetical protein
MYKFKDNKDFIHKMMLFTRLISKLYLIYSIRFAKATKDVKDISYSIVQDIINKSADEVIDNLKRKRGTREGHNPGWYDLNYLLSENLIENAKRKNLICRLSAMLEEDYKSSDISIHNKIFASRIDIEHIQSYLDKDKNRREDILKEWGGNINSIGNLMILEETLNRSIGNSEYKAKIEKYKNSSNFAIVHAQVQQYPEWNLELCEERKKSEVQKISDYLMS